MSLVGFAKQNECESKSNGTLVKPKIVGKWMFIPIQPHSSIEMIGFDPSKNIGELSMLNHVPSHPIGARLLRVVAVEKTRMSNV